MTVVRKFPKWKQEDVWIMYCGQEHHVYASCIHPENNQLICIAMDIFDIYVMEIDEWEKIPKFKTPIGAIEKEIEYHQGIINRLNKEIKRITPIWENKK